MMPRPWYEESVWDLPGLTHPSRWPAARMREEWENGRVMRVPEFARAAAVARMRAELLEVLPYAKMQDTSVEDMHGMSRFSGAYIPRDLLRPYEMVLRVYVDRTFKRAVSSIVGAPIYEVADPLTACVGLYVPGRSGEVDWHHDGEDLVACLMLRAPEAGGLLEMDRGDGETTTHPSRPGDLLVFDGRRLKHRVTPSRGDRLTVLFCYGTRPGIVGPSEKLVRSLYGRSTELHREMAKREGGRLTLHSNERSIGGGSESEPWG